MTSGTTRRFFSGRTPAGLSRNRFRFLQRFDVWARNSLQDPHRPRSHSPRSPPPARPPRWSPRRRSREARARRRPGPPVSGSASPRLSRAPSSGSVTSTSRLVGASLRHDGREADRGNGAIRPHRERVAASSSDAVTSTTPSRLFQDPSVPFDLRWKVEEKLRAFRADALEQRPIHRGCRRVESAATIGVPAEAKRRWLPLCPLSTTCPIREREAP